MGRVRNASIGTGGFRGKTFGISGIENDKAGATTHKAAKSGRSGGASLGGSSKPKKSSKMPQHKGKTNY